VTAPVDLTGRIAGAPISWGVCEVPGWGHQLPVDRVLQEMRELGLAATEFGPDGFLPDAPQDKQRVLAAAGLQAVGAFVPAVLHEPAHDPAPGVERALAGLVTAGASTLVLAAATGVEGYDSRPELDRDGWSALLGNLDRMAALAAAAGLTACLHPHVGTMVETRDDVLRVLGGAAVPLCLDTGHLLAGGTDPLEVVEQAADRVAHVHLKDVDASAAARVRGGAVSYTEAVQRGMYRPLGDGDVDITGIVQRLERTGYRGWYVLEQDTVLRTDPPPGSGPLDDVRASLEFLGSVRA
jgi:inosose dehydratase